MAKPITQSPVETPAPTRLHSPIHPTDPPTPIHPRFGRPPRVLSSPARMAALPPPERAPPPLVPHPPSRTLFAPTPDGPTATTQALHLSADATPPAAELLLIQPRPARPPRPKPCPRSESSRHWGPFPHPLDPAQPRLSSLLINLDGPPSHEQVSPRSAPLPDLPSRARPALGRASSYPAWGCQWAGWARIELRAQPTHRPEHTPRPAIRKRCRQQCASTALAATRECLSLAQLNSRLGPPVPHLD